MYIHLGNNVSVSTDDIIGIFDIENTSTSESTKNFLRHAAETGRTVSVSYEMPKSFIVCTDRNNQEIIYISQISASALRKRAAQNDEIQNWRI